MEKVAVSKVSMDKKHFPKGFLWGAATASYQVEGGIENNDWAQAARDGKVPVCGKATDHYNRFEGDFDIAKSLSQNAHRFSIEWSRIEPEEGRFDEEEIEHYRKVIRSLKAKGLEPFVTLWHFTLPLWFTKKGGFQNKNAPEIFSKYCEFVISRLGNEAKYWMTINEPLVWASGGYLKGRWPPFHKNFFSYLLVQRKLVSAHKLAYKKIKNIFPDIKIGIAQNEFCFESSGGLVNDLKMRFMKWAWNDSFLNAISQYQEFIGLNYYRHWKFGEDENIMAVDITDMGWGIYPKGIYSVLVGLKKYKVPVYITENGLADENDEKRIEFINSHLKYIKEAIDDGADVRGYFYWSLLDNFEWSYGFTKRFGLVEIDYETFERRVRPSALIYKEIAKNNVL